MSHQIPAHDGGCGQRDADVDSKLGVLEQIPSAVAPDAKQPWIIQFQRGIERRERKHLQGTYGLSLAEYVGSHAYLEVLTEPDMEFSPDDLTRGCFTMIALFGAIQRMPEEVRYPFLRKLLGAEAG